MDKNKRIILFSGKGGVGKTTLSLITGLKISSTDRKVIVISLDQAHSLRDSLDLSDKELFSLKPGNPIKITENLSIQEIDIQTEIDKNWYKISSYLFSLFKTGGFDDIVAEELAVIPGMGDLIGLLYINKYYKTGEYDTIILDCPPTGESLQFIAMPDMLEWYIKKLFKLERNIARIARPFVKKLTELPLPEDDYFASLKTLFLKLEGIDKILFDPAITTGRLVTNLEKMVLQETKRAYMYFNLFNINIDAIYVNRVLDEKISDPFFNNWKELQAKYKEHIRDFFYPVPIINVPLLNEEVVGIDKLSILSNAIYKETDPGELLFKHKAIEINGSKGSYTMKIFIPYVNKDDIYLYRSNQELIIRIGSFKKHLFLPDSLKKLDVLSARKEDDFLYLDFGVQDEKT